MFDRTFYELTEFGGHPVDKLMPFVWEKDRSKSFETFKECYELTKQINHSEFKTFKYKTEQNRRERNGEIQEDIKMDDLLALLKLEDKFNCSGMCRAALFYFDKNINTNIYPHETCLHHVKQFIGDKG